MPPSSPLRLRNALANVLTRLVPEMSKYGGTSNLGGDVSEIGRQYHRLEIQPICVSDVGRKEFTDKQLRVFAAFTKPNL
jgi:hypothetical protein